MGLFKRRKFKLDFQPFYEEMVKICLKDNISVFNELQDKEDVLGNDTLNKVVKMLSSNTVKALKRTDKQYEELLRDYNKRMRLETLHQKRAKYFAKCLLKYIEELNARDIEVLYKKFDVGNREIIKEICNDNVLYNQFEPVKDEIRRIMGDCWQEGKAKESPKNEPKGCDKEEKKHEEATPVESSLLAGDEVAEKKESNKVAEEEKKGKTEEKRCKNRLERLFKQ